VGLRRHRERIIVIHLRCRKCGRKMRVVAGSVTARERECNLCVYSEASRAGRTLVDFAT
jgi:hypothetical protein